MPDSAAEHAPSLDPPGGQRTGPYRVLARTYRPQRLSELIGQEALVRTLTNALRTGRIAHAFLLTGIRGVGKTTTARIIARALNCIGPDGTGQPTPEPCGQCTHCVGIAEGRHIDVLEMDAATRTGIDDVRELVDSVRYAPTSARYKVYIVDEVHMLSEKAFNGLLKTLEEPPPQTIFIFATTEVRKVPVTVLSRCQRFDLRRIEGERLGRHLAEIAAKEGVRIEPGALALLVRAAEGSVRDGLSLLDQAIALLGAADGEAAITAAQVQDMLGLADRGRVLTLFEQMADGAVAGALARLTELYDLGTEPEAVLQDLLEICHWLTRIKVAPEAAQAFGVAEADARRGEVLAARLTLPVLARNWQMLLKGLEDVRQAPSPLLAAEMVLVRLACVAELPPPAELARALRSGRDQVAAAPPGAAPAPRPTAPGPVARALRSASQVAPAPPLDDAEALAEPEAEVAPAALPRSFAEAVDLFRRGGEPMLHGWLYQAAHLVHFEPGRIELQLGPGTPAGLTGRIAAALGRWTGRPWLVSVGGDGAHAAPTLAEQDAAAKRARIDALACDPRVKRVLESFPGARIVEVRSAAD
ncbi:MAG TPA: DNA polymerase III subunit gamma/tau [Geminicoccaceae bacterium]|nr:DNA polymerase III subunit gamma/tau [Geminicoccaceae bacterium]